MCIEVKETDHGTIVVNNKEIFKDADGKWVSRQELSPQEQNALNNYVSATAKQDHNN